MRTVIRTLFLIFAILLSSIQLSAQSGNQELPDLPDRETFENIPSGRSVRLSNGHVYQSLGTGIIHVRYNGITREAFIRQGGRTTTTDTRGLPNEENFENIPLGNTIVLANGHHYISQGNEPINVRYNTIRGVATVRQNNRITALGEEGLTNYRRFYYKGPQRSGPHP